MTRCRIDRHAKLEALNARTLNHLRDVLVILSDLHSDDRCRALGNALAFYNEQRPNEQVEPVGGGHSRLVYEIADAPNNLVELIQDALIAFGPDGHCDGAAEIAAIVAQWFRDKQ